MHITHLERREVLRLARRIGTAKLQLHNAKRDRQYEIKAREAYLRRAERDLWRYLCSDGAVTVDGSTAPL